VNCPKCKNKALEPFENDGVEFDFCADGCLGVWCDHGELKHYVETINDLPGKVNSLSQAVQTLFKCPKECSNNLVELPYIKGKEILLDYCPSCHGLWFDFKELGKVESLAINIDKVGKLERTMERLRQRGFKVMGSS
jgi:uncharacterized protein